VRETARSEFYVPDSFNGAGGRLLGATLAAIAISPRHSPATGGSGEDVLARMSSHLDKGDLLAAVEEGNNVTGRTAAPLRDWLQEAQDRLAADQAMRLLHIHGSVLNMRMVK